MVDDTELKGNSNAQKTKEKIQPVTSNVIVKKESELSKIKKKFFAEDVRTAGGYVLGDVIIPGLKKTLSEIVKRGIDFLIYGSKGSGQNSGPGLISYTNYYTRNNPDYSNSLGNPNSVNRSASTVYAVNDVIFPEMVEAEETLLRMKEIIASYGMVSVSDFYDLIGRRGSFVDSNWGWRDLSTAEIIRVNEGYSIRYPRVIPLEQK